MLMENGYANSADVHIADLREKLAKVEAERDELARQVKCHEAINGQLETCRDCSSPVDHLDYNGDRCSICDTVVTESLKVRDDLKAENARLRAALNQTLDCDHDFQTCKCDDLLTLAKEPTE